MPKLFQEMAKGLRGDGNELLREFVVLPKPSTPFEGGGKRRFTYYEIDYPSLRDYVDLLNGEGYLEDRTAGSTPIFKMREPFVRLLKEHA